MEAIKRSEAVAEAVRLDDDEEAALGIATVDDLVNIVTQYFSKMVAKLKSSISQLFWHGIVFCTVFYPGCSN